MYYCCRSISQRLAAEAGVKQDMETRTRSEDAAVDAKFGDISSVEIDDDPTSWITFGYEKFA